MRSAMIASARTGSHPDSSHHDALPLDQIEVHYIQSLESRGLSRFTIRNAQQTFNCLRRYELDRSVRLTSATLTATAIQDFGAWLRDTPMTVVNRGTLIRSPGGIAARLRVVRALVRWLADENLMATAPRVRIPRVPYRLFVIPTDEQIGSLWACKYLSGRSEQATRNRALIGLMSDSGLRLTEVATLDVEGVFLQDQLIRVIGKGNKERFVPFGRTVAGYVQDWLKVRGAEPGPLFELQVRGVDALFRTLTAHLGWKIHPHMLRHYAATQMVRAGMDIYALKRVLGHAHISTTEIYLTLSHADIQAKHQLASPMDRLPRTEEQSNTRKRRRLAEPQWPPAFQPPSARQR